MINRKNLKILSMAAFAGIFFIALAGFGQASQGETDGFRGLRWGIPAENLGSRELVQGNGTEADKTVYRKPDEDLIYGRAKVTGINYVFTRNHLTSVTLRVDSYLQYLLLKEEAVKEFGEGTEIQGKPDDYSWNGKKTQIMLVSNFKKT